MTTRIRARKANPTERTILTARKDAECAELRAKGYTYPQIARERKCAASTAYAAVQRAIAAVPVEAVNELRQIECDRLDLVIARLWDIANDHGVAANDTISALAGIMRASESKRKLLGLDAPARQTITVITEDAVDAELRRLELELARRAEQPST